MGVGGGGGPVVVGAGGTTDVGELVMKVFVKVSVPPIASVADAGIGIVTVADAGGLASGKGHEKPQSPSRLPLS